MVIFGHFFFYRKSMGCVHVLEMRHLSEEIWYADIKDIKKKISPKN